MVGKGRRGVRIIANEKADIADYLARLLLDQMRSAKCVLDVGCGEGYLISAFKNLGLQVKGVDISLEMLRVAEKKVGYGNVSVCDIAKDKLPFRNKTFDIVTATEVVEHLTGDAIFFKEVFRVLKPEGLFFMTTPNHGSIFSYFFRNFVKDDPTHINLQKEKYWIQKIKKAGFSVKMVRGITLFGFPPLEPLRQIFRTFKLPARITPVFSPIRQFCGTILIFAMRN